MEAAVAASAPVSNEKIECKVCGAKVHAIKTHLRDTHPAMSVSEYQIRFPGEPLLSPKAVALIEAEKAKRKGPTIEHATVLKMPESKPQYLHEVFGLGENPAAKNSKGQPIPVKVLSPTGRELEMVEANPIDENHVWDAENLKVILMALELNIPLYLWGHTGTGKTTDLLQVAARLRRPILRLQHTINTEEAHILGMWVMRGGDTIFQPGPLPEAMRNGWIYLADEYDFALASVLSVYQPVLEGHSLMIKDAPDEWRIVKPHPNFRFWATGNTNGSGDETGLYAGTNLQNMANYDRFGMCLRKHYMKPAQEAQIVAGHSDIHIKDAEKLVDFATKVRDAYESAKLTNPISPRALINAAMIGIRRGNFRTGIALAYGNKLNKVDREVVDGIAQRIFGS